MNAPTTMPKFKVGDMLMHRGKRYTVSAVSFTTPTEYSYVFNNDGISRFGMTIDKEARVISMVPRGGRKSRKSRKTRKTRKSRKTRRRRSHRRM
jgi:hypothetical protein